MKTSTQKIEFRRVISDAEIQSYIDVCATMRPDQLTTVKEMRDQDATIPETANLERFISLTDGEVVAASNILQAFWTPEKSLYMLKVSQTSDFGQEVCQHILDSLIGRAKAHCATKVNIWTPQINSTMTQVIEQNEFKFDQSNPESKLELEDLDMSQFQTAIDSLRGSNLRVITLQDLLIEDPGNGMRRYHELDNRLTADVPLPWEFTGEPFESFEKSFMLESHTFDTIQIVLDGDFLVATSMLFRNRHNPIYFLTGLTGVDRAYRRRGIAQALKAINFNLAKEKGGKVIFCDNEENNPMLQLNYQLGFKPYWVWNSYSKEV